METIVSRMFQKHDEEKAAFSGVLQERFFEAKIELGKLEECLQDLLRLSEERDNLAKIQRIAAESIARYSRYSTDLYNRAIIESSRFVGYDDVTALIRNYAKEIRSIRKSVEIIDLRGRHAAKERNSKKRKQGIRVYEAQVRKLLVSAKDPLERKEVFFRAGIYSLLLLDDKYRGERIHSNRMLFIFEEEKEKTLRLRQASQANNNSCGNQKKGFSFFPPFGNPDQKMKNQYRDLNSNTKKKNSGPPDDGGGCGGGGSGAENEDGGRRRRRNKPKSRRQKKRNWYPRPSDGVPRNS